MSIWDFGWIWETLWENGILLVFTTFIDYIVDLATQMFNSVLGPFLFELDETVISVLLILVMISFMLLKVRSSKSNAL